MKITAALHEMWVNGFFETHVRPSVIKAELHNKYGINPTNVTMNLKLCKKFLSQDSKGWIQRTRYVAASKAAPPHDNRTLQRFITDKRLIGACTANYLSKNYADMVFSGMRHLEVRVREKSGLPASDIGADLMEKAFKPSTGILVVPSCATPSEQDGLKQILKGAMMFHRNAKGHREDAFDIEPALRILGYVDYLLGIVESSKKR